MRGMNRNNGTALTGLDHLKQSIQDILTTPKGSRVMRREYGSDIFKLIDQPVNDEWRVDMYAAVTEALDRWEPRVEIESIDITKETGGSCMVELDIRLEDGSLQTISGIQI